MEQNGAGNGKSWNGGNGAGGNWGTGAPGNRGNGEWGMEGLCNSIQLLKVDTLCGSYNSMSNFIEACVLLYVKLTYTVLYDWCSFIKF